MSEAGSDSLTDEVLTVAEAANRLGTTIPRLRRLLAKLDMATCSRQEAIQTKRGTRTSTVVLVLEIDRLKSALSMGERGPIIQKQEQEHLRVFSETEVFALQTTLRRTEELLQSKDNELSAKDEIITLLREKIEGLERRSLAVDFQEREQERSFSVPATNKNGVAVADMPQTAPERPPEAKEEQPKTEAGQPAISPLPWWKRIWNTKE
jgi:hypothetical protein